MHNKLVRVNLGLTDCVQQKLQTIFLRKLWSLDLSKEEAQKRLWGIVQGCTSKKNVEIKLFGQQAMVYDAI